jgi:hypothetical protein
MTTLALAVVAVAWLIQLLHSWSGHKNIHVYFVLAYALGVALMIVEGYQGGAGMSTDMWFYVASFVFALLVFLRVRK